MTGTDAPDDKERLTTLFRENSAQVRSFASRRVGQDDAQEIVAETFLVAWRRIDDVPDPALPWLYKVATFEIANHRRRKEKHSHVELSVVDEVKDLARQNDLDKIRERSEAVSLAFFALKRDDQEILRLATWEELSTVDGARALECSTAAYRVRLHRARIRLARSAGVWGKRPATESDPVPFASQYGSSAAMEGPPTGETEAIR
jgi:RNA polymerase sigma-70 factor (ECF subfamily)